MSKHKSKQSTGKPAGKTAASKSGSPDKSASTGKASPKASKKPLNVWLIVAAVAVVVVIAAIVFLPRSKPAENSPAATQAVAGLPKEISVAQAKEKYDSDAFLLDVRQPEEWNEYHVPGTTLIPLGELQSRVDELPKDQEIVVVCRSGNRSQQGRDILLNAGFDQVTSMAGGVSSWRDAGYPTVSGP
jgi:rhodanese-related sulfurtransferase